MSFITVNDIPIETTYPIRYLRAYNIEVEAYRTIPDKMLVITQGRQRLTLFYVDGEYVFHADTVAANDVVEEKQKTDWEAYYADKKKSDTSRVTPKSILSSFESSYHDNSDVKLAVRLLEKGNLENVYFDGNKLTCKLLTRSKEKYTLVARVGLSNRLEISVTPSYCWSYWNDLIQYRVEE